jgi:F-box protein 39
MGNLAGLRHLELTDLMLEPHEAQHLLDEVCSLCCLTLHTLILINTTKLQYQLLHAGVFLNLQVTEQENLLLNYSTVFKEHKVRTQNIMG